MTFHQPSAWLLLLLPLALLAWLRWLSPRRRAMAAFSDTAALRAAGGGLARLRWLLPWLRMAGLAILVVALARPVRSDEHVGVLVEGIAIELVVDRSGSMQALDFIVDGRRVDRLAAVKEVVRDFVLGDDGLPGRGDDLIGLVAFARHADSLCPLTLDHGHLLTALEAIRPAGDRSEDGTAIGEGIALAAERLRDATERTGIDAARRIKSKVIVLLTDGENNVGDIDPRTAAELAASMGIRIYTIGAGTRGMAPFPVEFMGQMITRQVPVTIDEETLQEIARITGGRYFRATDTDSLREIYGEIDRLEKTRSEQRRSVIAKELAVEPTQWGWLHVPPLLLPALLLLLLELLLSTTRLRTLP